MTIGLAQGLGFVFGGVIRKVQVRFQCSISSKTLPFSAQRHPGVGLSEPNRCRKTNKKCGMAQLNRVGFRKPTRTYFSRTTYYKQAFSYALALISLATCPPKRFINIFTWEIDVTQSPVCWDIGIYNGR